MNEKLTRNFNKLEDVKSNITADIQNLKIEADLFSTSYHRRLTIEEEITALEKLYNGISKLF